MAEFNILETLDLVGKAKTREEKRQVLADRDNFATRALLQLKPVAKALAVCEGKIPTSGMPIPASCASCATVSTSHCSSPLRGSLMMYVPVPRLAIHFDSSSETSAPPNPNSPQNTSRAVRFRSTPLAIKMLSNPSRLKTKLTSTSTARLVAKNSNMRTISSP